MHTCLTGDSYSVYVLEASTSNRLTYCLPPLVSICPAFSGLVLAAALVSVADSKLQNLLSLLIRPLRYVLPQEEMRRARIGMLKITHLPHVLIIRSFEALKGRARQQLQLTIPTTHSIGNRDRKVLQTVKLAESPLRGRLNRKSLLTGRILPEHRDTRIRGSLEPDAGHRNPGASEIAHLDAKVDRLSSMIEQLVAASPKQADLRGVSQVS